MRFCLIYKPQSKNVMGVKLFSAKIKSTTLGLIVSVMAMLSIPTYSAEQVTGINGQSLVLNGVGVWKKSSKEIFLSALYLPYKSTSANDILSLNSDKHLEIRILARKIRPRRFAQILREYIVINNSKQDLSSLSLSILEFINMFKGNLKTGDIIAMDYIANDRLEVRINGSLMGQIKKAGLIAAILNSWIGQTPVTPEFKDGIMGKVPADTLSSLLASFSILEPSEGRVAETKSWVKQSGFLDAQIAKLGGKVSSGVAVASQSKPDTSEPKETVAKKPETKPEEKVVAEVKPKPKPKPVETKPKVTEKPIVEAKPKPTPKPQEQIKQVVDTTTKEQAIPPKEQVVDNTATPINAVVDTIAEASTTKDNALDLSLGDLLNDVEEDAAEDSAEEDEPQVSAADIAAEYKIKKEYEKKLIEWIRKYEKYPVKAFRRRMEGEGRIVVVVDRNGEVLQAEMAESTGKRLLDRGSLNTIKRAAPLPKMPDNLAGESYEFSVPIVYKL
jgi:periplasmic protein TonB